MGPLDDTRVRPENEFEPRVVATMTLHGNVADHHDENEQMVSGAGIIHSVHDEPVIVER